MSSDQVRRYLRTEELYREILDLVGESALDEISETTVRGKLDAVHSAGKIEGRLTALTANVMSPLPGDVWCNRMDWRDEVEVIDVSPAMIVHYFHGACPCNNPGHAEGGHRSASAVYQFMERYELVGRPDRLIEDWQRIVDSVTTDASPVVAYTVGSLWLCLTCGSGKSTAITVRRDALVSGETYLCGDCGSRIMDGA